MAIDVELGGGVVAGATERAAGEGEEISVEKLLNSDESLGKVLLSVGGGLNGWSAESGGGEYIR